MELLGDTLDLIAREKAGIMRAGVPCFTVPQPQEAMTALEVRPRQKISCVLIQVLGIMPRAGGLPACSNPWHHAMSQEVIQHGICVVNVQSMCVLHVIYAYSNLMVG